MSSDNFLAIIKEGKRWVGYYCCASIDYPYSDCFGCIAGKRFEATTELKALHKAQETQAEMNERGMYLEYGYQFLHSKWMTSEEKKKLCPCPDRKEIKVD